MFLTLLVLILTVVRIRAQIENGLLNYFPHFYLNMLTRNYSLAWQTCKFLPCRSPITLKTYLMSREVSHETGVRVISMIHYSSGLSRKRMDRSLLELTKDLNEPRGIWLNG